MNKLYFTFIIFLLMIRSSTAQFYTQYFDGADTVFDNSINVTLDTASANIWQIGKPQKIIFDSASTAPNAMVTDTLNYYPVNNTSVFTAQIPFDYPYWGVLAIQWTQKLDMDSALDGGVVEFSIDRGLTWQNVFNNPYVYNFYGFDWNNADTLSTGESVFSGTDSAWKDVWLCFSLSWLHTLPDTLNIRFTFKSDSINNNKEGWLIDNMLAHITFVHTVKRAIQTDYLNVYPNPTNKIVHLEAEALAEFHIVEHMELINSQGQVVEEWNNLPTKFWFDAGKYGSGIYLLRVKTNIQTEMRRIVVSK